MSPRRRSVLVGLALGVLVSLVALVVMAARSDDGADPSGDSVDVISPEAPERNDLSTEPLLTMDGGTTSLAEMTGAPLVINFWQRSCAPCLREMPAIEAVHKALGAKVRIVGVNGGDERDVAAQYASQRGVTYEIVRDPRFDVANDMKVSTYPATFLVSPDGKVLRSRYGEINENELRSMLNEEFGL